MVTWRMKPFHLVGGWRGLTLFALFSAFVFLLLSLLNGNPNFNFIYFSFDREFMMTVEAEMLRRRNVVSNVCSREGIGVNVPRKRRPGAIKHPPTPHYESFYFDQKHKLIWCPTYKAASTSWLFNFCVLAGLQEQFLDTSPVQLSKVARTFYPSLKFNEALKEADDVTNLKFFIVRHPFDRLLSAYRDKLENINEGKEHGTVFYYEKYGKKIVEKYRNRETSISPDRVEPTFEEFVTYLTDVDLSTRADEHWMPYYLYCTPCLLDYDVIAKFETLEQDQKYLILKANLKDKIAPTWKHKTKGTESKKVAEKYFAPISKELLIKLYDKYKLDFELFEYDIDQYLGYVKQ